MNDKNISTKQENFVQAYLFGNMSAVDAYISAGYTSGKSNKPYAGATRLLQRASIKQRIAELNSVSIGSSVYTRDYLSIRLYGIYERALQEDRLDTAVKSLVEIGKLCGLYQVNIDISIDSSRDERLSEISTADIAKFIIEHREK